MVKFATKYDRPPVVPEYNNGECIVETGGYMPMKQKVEAFIRAGRVLDEARNNYYDFDESVKDGDEHVIPSRSYIDPSEAQQDIACFNRAVENGLAIAEAEKVAQAVAEAEKKAKDEPHEPVKGESGK